MNPATRLISDFEARLTARTVFVPLSLAIAVLVVAHFFLLVATAILHIPLPVAVQRALDLNADGGLASLLSIVALAGAAALLFLIGLEARRRRAWDARYWFTLGAAVLLAAVLHTGFVRSVPNAAVLARAPLGEVRSYLWLISYGVATLALVPIFAPFLRRLPSSTRRDLQFAVWAYLAASIALEGVERIAFGAHGWSSAALAALVTATRAIELFAIAYFIAAVIHYVEQRGGPILLRISVPGTREADREVPLAPFTRADRGRGPQSEHTIRP